MSVLKSYVIRCLPETCLKTFLPNITYQVVNAAYICNRFTYPVTLQLINNDNYSVVNVEKGVTSQWLAEKEGYKSTVLVGEGAINIWGVRYICI